MDAGLDHERCYRAVASRDARFDGSFYTAVRTTGIYCRPSCPARTPHSRNVTFFRTPAAAQGAGFRACRRCRPDAVPGSAEWNARGDLVGRAMRLVADGAVERLGVAGVAARLGYSERHLNRLLTAELGVGLLAIARAQRAHTARLLLETTDLPVTEVAWAAGFGSVRSFNDTVRGIYGLAPTLLRSSRQPLRASPDGSAPRVPSCSTDPWSSSGSVEQIRAGHAPIVVRLAARAPFDPGHVLRFLGDHAVAGLEAWDGRTYRRALDLPRGHGTVACSAQTPGPGVLAEFRLADLRDLAPAVARVRRLFDLDADPAAVEEVLGTDPLLAPLLAARPGLRVPGSVDPSELLVRAIVGQQVSIPAARTLVGRLVAELGEPLVIADPELRWVFPNPDRIAAMEPARLAMPRSRAAAVIQTCAALADGRLVLDPGVDRTESVAALRRLRGIGPWTAGYVALRGLGDPDVMLAGDLGVRHAVAAHGGDDRPSAIDRAGHRWRPWRSYAVVHLWESLTDPKLPPPSPPRPTGHPTPSDRSSP